MNFPNSVVHNWVTKGSDVSVEHAYAVAIDIERVLLLYVYGCGTYIIEPLSRFMEK